MNVNLTSVTATSMQTVLTHMVLTNANVKWDTPAMDTHVQVILKMILSIFLNKSIFVNRLMNLNSITHAYLCTELL